jgi:hypothetical protein
MDRYKDADSFKSSHKFNVSPLTVPINALHHVLRPAAVERMILKASQLHHACIFTYRLMTPHIKPDEI